MKKQWISDELKWALSFLKPRIWGVLLIVVLTFGQNYFYAMIPTVGTNFLFELLSPEKIQQLYRYFFIALAIILLRALFDFFKNYSMYSIISAVSKKIRDMFFSHLMVLDIDFFKENKTGNIISVGVNDVEKMQADFYSGLVHFLSSSMIVIIVLVKLFLLNWKLSVISLGAIPLLYLIIRVLGNVIRSVSKKLRENLAELSINFHETLTGIEVVKAFAQEKKETESFKENTNMYRKTYLKLVRVMNIFGPFNEITLFLFALIIIGLGAIFIVRGTWELKGLTEYLILLGIITAPIVSIPKYISGYKVASASVERIRNILLKEPEIKEAENPISRDIEGKIEFKNVRFSYNRSQDVLKDISFTAEKGEVVALVGPSGGGKTTLVNLIPRFYDCKNGAILIDGVNVRDYSLKSLRSQIGIVSQNVILFNTTILENIRYAKREASEEEVISAAKRAYAYDFIMELPDQFQTNVGERGVRLSGGQKQRISIARTVLMNPEILILDEATSALDSESERYIQLAISNLMEGRTSITIAHRLSTISNAKKIFVIDEGKVIAVGDHEELLENCDLYKKIYNLQYFR